MRPMYLGRTWDLNHDRRVRDPKRYAGVRTRFRDMLNRMLGAHQVKYRTDLSRRTQKPTLVVLVRKGSDADVHRFAVHVLALQSFEGHPLEYRDMRSVL